MMQQYTQQDFNNEFGKAMDSESLIKYCQAINGIKARKSLKRAIAEAIVTSVVETVVITVVMVATIVVISAIVGVADEVIE